MRLLKDIQVCIEVNISTANHTSMHHTSRGHTVDEGRGHHRYDGQQDDGVEPSEERHCDAGVDDRSLKVGRLRIGTNELDWKPRNERGVDAEGRGEREERKDGREVLEREATLAHPRQARPSLTCPM